MFKRILLVVSFCVFVSYSYAGTKVIADFGGESAIPFYEPIQPVHDANAEQTPNAIAQTIEEQDLLPVVSHKLSPGQIQAKKLNLPGMTPLFLIGADATSSNWLKSNHQYLAKIGAVGYVVNVNNIDELNSLKNIAANIQILPVPGDNLAVRIGISHYPVLITSDGYQQ